MPSLSFLIIVLFTNKIKFKLKHTDLHIHRSHIHTHKYIYNKKFGKKTIAVFNCCSVYLVLKKKRKTILFFHF